MVVATELSEVELRREVESLGFTLYDFGIGAEGFGTGSGISVLWAPAWFQSGQLTRTHIVIFCPRIEFEPSVYLEAP